MNAYDVAVVGGGMVGLAVACGLASEGFSVVVLESSAPRPLETAPGQRVSALNRASERFLEQLGAWPAIPRRQAYRHMEVWEQDGPARLILDAATVLQPQLGYIIENEALRLALWQRAETLGVSLRAPAEIERLSLGDSGALILLREGEPLLCRLLVAADGAQSRLRQQFDIPLTSWDYAQSALVAPVLTTESHGECARQIFTAEGPLAFLPLWQPDLCSIVWSVPPERGAALLAMPEPQFEQQLFRAFDGRLGLCRLAGPRALLPLKARFARDMVRDRLVLVGDAAHTIHPLAGQGVNLGLMDAAALVEQLALLKANHQEWWLRDKLRPYERWRKAEAARLLAAMEGIKRLFANQHPLLRLMRGAGMGLLTQARPLQQWMMEEAMGLRGDLPSLAR